MRNVPFLLVDLESLNCEFSSQSFELLCVNTSGAIGQGGLNVRNVLRALTPSCVQAAVAWWVLKKGKINKVFMTRVSGSLFLCIRTENVMLHFNLLDIFLFTCFGWVLN